MDYTYDPFLHLLPSVTFFKSTPRLKILLVLPSSSCCTCVLTVYMTTLYSALLHTQLGVVKSTMYHPWTHPAVMQKDILITKPSV